jgi:hypothetical protein
MWALHITRGFENKQLMEALSDKDEHVRAWAIQLLSEDRSPSEQALTKFVEMSGRMYLRW